jgi:hypothetical protein
VYLIGGYDADGPTYHKSLYVLDLLSRQWRELPGMLLKRCYIATVLFQVNVLGIIMILYVSRLDSINYRFNCFNKC